MVWITFNGAVDVVVPIHNAWDLARDSLQSVVQAREESKHKIIIVDDGSSKPVAQLLEKFCKSTANVELIRNGVAGGFCKAANQGLRASTSPVVIVLNSDTLVAGNWITKLSNTIMGVPGVGIAGPLSNAASHQSIPRNKANEREMATGQTPINKLPSGLSLEELNNILETRKPSTPFRVPLIHGFCFAIRREVLDSVGYFDEESFPMGYGEENDYCVRAVDAGWSLAISLDTYVWHHKTGSYSPEQRQELVKSGGEQFLRKHGQRRLENILESLRESGQILETMFDWLPYEE